MDAPRYPFLTRVWNVLATKSSVISFALLLLSVVFPITFVLALGAAIYFAVSGRLTYESNRRFVQWLGRTLSQRLGDTPQELISRACQQGKLASLVPRSAPGVPIWYTPKMLHPT